MFNQCLIETKCPYCGHVTKNLFSVPRFRGLITCDQEFGGCDEDYAAYISLSVAADVTVVPLSFDDTGAQS